ncbi:MAG: HAD domain-containing protein [Flavobacterium sp.]|jgi:hypothetical protein
MIVFLDIDGVMVHASPWKVVENQNDGFYKFSPTAVIGLKNIISNTNASIILTTSHKNRFTLKEWKKIFRNRGIDVESISKLQTRKIYASRKEEILTWCKRHKEINNFIIIDDDKSLNGLPTEMKEKLILTNSSVGLTQFDAQLAIKMLNKKQRKIPVVKKSEPV